MMSESGHSRRKLLKSIVAGSGAIVAEKSLPESWSKPVVDSVILPAHAQTSTETFYAIGDTGPGGGIVFIISNGGLNGMEAAPTDQSTDTQWGCSTIVTGATGTAIGDGATNTQAILGFPCGTASSAALIASMYAGGGFSDWFLPSRDELNTMYTQLRVNSLGSFANDGYWASSERPEVIVPPVGFAHGTDFTNGNGNFNSKTVSLRVRAARGF